MKVRVKKADPVAFSGEAIVVCHFEDSKKLAGAAYRLDRGSGGLLGEVMKSGDFTGKHAQVSVIYTRGALPARRVLLLGLGRKKEFDLERLRKAFSRAARTARELGLAEFAICLDIPDRARSLEDMTEAVVEGAILGLYRFTQYKTPDKDNGRNVKGFSIIAASDSEVRRMKTAAERAVIISKAVYFARDLVSTPSNEMTPSDIARSAKQAVVSKKVRLTVFDNRKMEKLGMNALLSVARGSMEPARFIILEYSGARKAEKPYVIVGKGITFDSGGISLKPPDKMEEMKADMSGGAAVLAVIKAAAELGLPLNLVGLVPATENLPGGRAYKPGDVLRSMSGKTIEVISTDAEGRLILADALTYAGRFKPKAIIDVATLTGACVIALGDDVVGMMGTDDTLKRDLRSAAEETGEKLWELPLWDDYAELIKSDVADMKNTGGRAGGAITAAVFLGKFVEKTPWVHLDIAGPAWRSSEKPYIPRGASAVGVRLLLRFLRDRAAAKPLRAA
ncbi:MAG TPA: leucyl aminopeptidase [Syntrophales bacterium]|nr:leucyl aminopeptidase [Syntrophales bacterium]